MDNTQEQLDPSIVALTKAIGHQESGGDYTKSGDNGHSLGAYQWNNPTPLAKGQIPKNFASYAHDVGVDSSDFSPAKQDEVAYKTVKKWGTPVAQGGLGLTPAQIASKWNSGNPEAYKTVTPGYNAKEGVKYDVKSYVDNVAKYYQEYNKNPQDNSSSSSKKTFSESVKEIQNSQPNSDLQAGNPTTLGNTTIGNTIANLIPGTKMAQGLGYGIAAATGSQKGLIDANNRGIDIEGQLLQQIKNNKAKGKDTTRLEKALKQLIPDTQSGINQVSDVGTGGITSGQVLKSAAGLATLPATAYAGGLIGNALKGGSALASPELETALNIPLKEFNTLSSAGKLDALSSSLADAGQGLGASGKQILQKAIQEISPSVLKEAGIGSFSELNPKTAKVLGLGAKALKILGGGLIAGAGIGEGSNLIKGLFK